MVILIVDIILMAIFIAAGIKSDCGGILVLAIFLIAIINIALSDAEDVANNPDARKRAKRQIDKDQKEWDEWRYKYH